MSKSKETIKSEENPFAGFNILSNSSEPIKIEDKTDEQNEEKVLSDFEKALNEEKTKKIEKPIVKTTETEENKEETPTDQEEQESNEQEESTEDDDFSYKDYIKHMSDKGILDFDEEEFKDEDFKSDDILEKIQEKTLEKRYQKKVDSYSEKLRKAIEWEENGGDIDQFYDYYYNNVRYADIEMSTEDTELQKAILRDALRASGEEDNDRITAKIEKYELSGILEDEAKDALDKLKKMETKQDEEKERNQKLQAEQKKLKDIEEWNNLKKAVLEAEDIAGFKVTPKVKEQLWEHMTKAVDRSGKTKLQINNETKGLKAKLLYAYLDMVDFDISKLEKQVKTKVTSDLRKNLGKYSDSRNKINRVSNSDVEQDNPFQGFKRDW